MSTFKDKKVLITGGAMGLGRLIAESAIAEGAGLVILWDLNGPRLDTTAEELRKAGSSVETRVVNVADLFDIKKAAAETLAAHGAVDMLFNNAGIVVGKSFVEHTHEDFERTIQVNVLGVMHVARAFVPAMVAQKSGHVINIASAAGLIPVPRQSAYCPSKWACLAFSEILRLEMEEEKTGVHVTTVCPSYINTGMFDGVKAPLLTPILEPDYAVARIIDAVKRDKILLRMPWIVNLLPFMRGTQPARLFDFMAGKIFGVYQSMEKFKGH